MMNKMKNPLAALVLSAALVLGAGACAAQPASPPTAPPPAAVMEAHEAASDEFDPAKNKRLLSISENLRCLVCQNQTIADSNADLAIDLRRQVREQIAQGRTDQEIIRYMTDRYGDFVLYKPPFKASTALLWAGPVILLVLILGWYAVSVRRRRRDGQAAAPLTEQERRDAMRLLSEGEAGQKEEGK